MEKNHYSKLLIMQVISFVIMYLVMFLNVESTDHIYLSATRFYMASLMVSPMALIMILMMEMMYKNKNLNRIIVFVSIAVFVIALVGLRKQLVVSDEQYMKAMIPHHSSAIMTSKNANLQDPEVQKLAESIIKAQEEEIAKMKAALERLEK